MIDINELRQLTRRYVGTTAWSPTSPQELIELLDRLEAAERERDSYKFAFSEYSEKTEWVQQGINDGTVSAKYLGWHRADVVADLLNAAEKERDALRAKIEAMERQKPVAGLDDGTCRAGSKATAHRVVTNETKRDMPASVAASFSVPLYLAPPAQKEKANDPQRNHRHPTQVRPMAED